MVLLLRHGWIERHFRFLFCELHSCKWSWVPFAGGDESNPRSSLEWLRSVDLSGNGWNSNFLRLLLFHKGLATGTALSLSYQRFSPSDSAQRSLPLLQHIPSSIFLLIFSQLLLNFLLPFINPLYFKLLSSTTLVCFYVGYIISAFIWFQDVKGFINLFM